MLWQLHFVLEQYKAEIWSTVHVIKVAAIVIWLYYCSRYVTIYGSPLLYHVDLLPINTDAQHRRGCFSMSPILVKSMIFEIQFSNQNRFHFLFRTVWICNFMALRWWNLSINHVLFLQWMFILFNLRCSLQIVFLVDICYMINFSFPYTAICLTGNMCTIVLSLISSEPFLHLISIKDGLIPPWVESYFSSYDSDILRKNTSETEPRSSHHRNVKNSEFRKLGQGKVFTRVCHSVHRAEGVSILSLPVWLPIPMFLLVGVSVPGLKFLLRGLCTCSHVPSGCSLSRGSVILCTLDKSEFVKCW